MSIMRYSRIKMYEFDVFIWNYWSMKIQFFYTSIKFINTTKILVDAVDVAKCRQNLI